MKYLGNSFERRSHRFFWIASIVVLLLVAGCSKKDEAIETLKNQKVAISAENLIMFAGQGNIEKVRLLLDAGVDVSARDKLGATALISASWAGKQEVVDYLLETKVDVNAVAQSKMTALLAAISQKNDQVALALLDHGANPNIIDSTGTSPLILASWQGNATLVRALTGKNADPNYKRTADGLTAMKAAKKDDIVQHLRSRGAVE